MIIRAIYIAVLAIINLIFIIFRHPDLVGMSIANSLQTFLVLGVIHGIVQSLRRSPTDEQKHLPMFKLFTYAFFCCLIYWGVNLPETGVVATLPESIFSSPFALVTGAVGFLIWIVTLYKTSKP